MNIIVIKVHLELPETENKGEWKKKIYGWADKYFKTGYTVYETEGVWKGNKGAGFTIERYEDNLSLPKDPEFRAELGELARVLKQDSIMLTIFMADSEIISAKEEIKL